MVATTHVPTHLLLVLRRRLAIVAGHVVRLAHRRVRRHQNHLAHARRREFLTEAHDGARPVGEPMQLTLPEFVRREAQGNDLGDGQVSDIKKWKPREFVRIFVSE